MPKDIEAIRSLLDSRFRTIRQKYLQIGDESVIKTTMNGLINAGRDIIGMQHITNNNVSGIVTKDKGNDQPVIDVEMNYFTSVQGTFTISLRFSGTSS